MCTQIGWDLVQVQVAARKAWGGAAIVRLWDTPGVLA